MDKSIIEKYKAEMLKMQSKARVVSNMQPSAPQKASEPQNNSQGQLQAIVTTLRSLYPVPNAEVTVFSGDPENMQIIARSFTDQSGKSEVFNLNAPDRSLSMSAGATVEPFATYNMMVKAEGYLDNIHLNIPVFSGVTSLQRSNMLLLETAGVNKGPQVFNELEQFNL